VNEGDGNAVFTVTRSGGTSGVSTVEYATADGSATAPSDYAPVSGLLTFGPGVTTQQISVPLVDDGTYEPAEGSFVDLSTPTNATISDGQGAATVLDDDAPPRRIVFASSRTGRGDIYVMDADGANQTRLTTDPAFDGAPAWSPDGTKIAFASNRTGNGDIYVMNADGSNQVRLTTHASVESVPAWSPDGTKIAFASGRTGNGDIYVMDASGANQIRLTTDAAIDGEPAWSPDGTKVAFASGRSGNGDIYVMDASGANQTRLTTSSGTDLSPAWR
jgi:Tol biopolymer transport system component